MSKTEIKKSSLLITEDGIERKTSTKRLEVLKTYKIYIGGQFPRTESGRYYVVKNSSGKQLANICLSSRKDFRDAVAAARNAEMAPTHVTICSAASLIAKTGNSLATR